MSTTTRSRTRAQPGIQRFTRASKPGAALPASKSLLLDGAKASNNNSTCQLTASPSKKRKLNEIANDANVAVASIQQDTPSKTLKFSDLSVSTPRSSRVSRTTSRTPSKTSKNTRTRTVKKVGAIAYPTAFNDFANLHSSFLKALSLHSAHNGSSPSADLRELLPSIEKIWKKRKVAIKDLQRIIHVWDRDGGNNNEGEEEAFLVPRFRLANYGLGKICIERVDNTAGSTGLFDENRVHDRFVTLLEKTWRAQAGVQKKQEEEAEKKDDFYTDKLDLAPIHDCLTPLTTFRKGQQRLQDLKGGVIKAKTAMLKAAEASPAATAPAVPRDPVADRRKGLFERIKNKQLLQAKLGPAPTKEQLLRRSAAQRAEDVARVLTMLRPAYTMRRDDGGAVAQKKPFIWQSLIQTVQDSLRNPIPAEEIGACLEILAQKDVAGDWIEVVSIGSFKSVVLMSGHDVSKDIGIRVSKMEF